VHTEQQILLVNHIYKVKRVCTCLCNLRVDVRSSPKVTTAGTVFLHKVLQAPSILKPRIIVVVCIKQRMSQDDFKSGVRVYDNYLDQPISIYTSQGHVLIIKGVCCAVLRNHLFTFWCVEWLYNNYFSYICTTKTIWLNKIHRTFKSLMFLWLYLC
jgi:hypothetical protein